MPKNRTTALDLGQFTGSENLFAHPINPRFCYTDGIRYVAQTAGAYWLLDVLATELHLNDSDYFGVVLLVVKDGQASLEVMDDLPPNRWMLRKNIRHTDFPEGVWKFYAVWDGERITLMVPSEY